MNLGRAFIAMATLATVCVFFSIYALVSALRLADSDVVRGMHAGLATSARRIAAAYDRQIAPLRGDLATTFASKSVDAYGRRIVVATIGDNEGTDGGYYVYRTGIVADGPQRVVSKTQRDAIARLARDIEAGGKRRGVNVTTDTGDLVAIEATPLVDETGVAFARERLSASALRGRRTTFPLIAIAIACCAGLIGVGAWIVLQIRRDVRRVIDTIAAVESDPGARPPLPGGDLGRIAAAVSTMAERRALAEAVAQRNERLAAVGRLAANAAHEIRNPLNSLRLQIAVLQRRLGATIDEPVVRLSVEIARLDAVVRGMLATASDAPVPQTDVDLYEVTRRAIETLEHDATSRDRWFTFSCETPETTVHGDDVRLAQLAINVLANAVDASPANTAIDVRITPGPVLRVLDRGAGISLRDVPRLFEPFYTTKPSGTGLGLAIAHEIARAHGARIDVSSTPGHTEFAIDFGASHA